MEKILPYVITQDCFKHKIYDKDEIRLLKEEMLSKYEEGNYSFANKIQYRLFTQKNKKRKIAEIQNGINNEGVDSRLEYFLSISLNRLVVSKYKLKFNNRNKIILGLFNVLKALKNFKDYTIIRFDFSKYFDSISCRYVYEKYLKELDFTKEQKKCLGAYVSSMKYCTAGLPLSNTFAEIIGQDFDTEIRKHFKGIIFYARYVDDGILILNNKQTLDNVKDSLNDVINITFYDNTILGKKVNKTKIDYNTKFDYLTNSNIKQHFDYLGYSIELENKSNNIKVTLGLTLQKQKKYYNKTKNLIMNFAKKPEKLRIILKLFSRRVVYTILKNNGTKRWISKGIVYNYKDLFFFGEKIDHKTKTYLSSLFNKCFSELKISVPYYLKNVNSSRGYNLFYCLKNNKTFILDENIGIKENHLDNLLKVVAPDYNCNNKKYNDKVKQLLIECKIGY